MYWESVGIHVSYHVEDETRAQRKRRQTSIVGSSCPQVLCQISVLGLCKTHCNPDFLFLVQLVWVSIICSQAVSDYCNPHYYPMWPPSGSSLNFLSFVYVSSLTPLHRDLHQSLLLWGSILTSIQLKLHLLYISFPSYLGIRCIIGTFFSVNAHWYFPSNWILNSLRPETI